MTSKYCPNGHKIAKESMGIRIYCDGLSAFAEKIQIGFVSFCPMCKKRGRYYFSDDLISHISTETKETCESNEVKKTLQSLHDLESKRPKNYLDNVNIKMLREKIRELDNKKATKFV